jgi:hypothetical protein
MRRAALVVVLVAAAARADTPTGIGVFAPSSPFDGPVARLDAATAIATHLAGQVGGAYVGRAYGRAADFVAAVRRKEVQFALLDASFVAAMGVPYTVLATCEKGGDAEVAWEVVTSTGAKSVRELFGKSVATPAIGSREEAFVEGVLLGGEVPASSFKIAYAPDALSALGAVAHGRAEAAFVPRGLPAPPGTHRLATLGPSRLPVFVALPGAPTVPEVKAAIVRYTPAICDRLVAADGKSLQGLMSRFGPRTRRAPWVAPQLRVGWDAALPAQTFTVPRPSLSSYTAGK